MSNANQQNLLLATIAQLQAQYELLPKPCVALLISKHYRVLANLANTQKQQQRYADEKLFWLNCYINNQRHSEKMQHQLHDFIQFHESAFNAI